MYRLILCVLALLVLMAKPSHAAEIVLGSQVQYVLGGVAEVLEDPDRRLSVSDLVAGCCEQGFRSATGDIENHGFTKSAFWFRVVLRNASGEPRWFVEVPDGLVYWLDVYVLRADGRLQSQRGGATVAARDKQVKSRNQVFLVDIGEGETVTLYVRVASELPVMIPINLWRVDAFAGAAVDDAAFHLWYFGFMAAMVFYNFFLGITLKDQSYVFYSVYFMAALFIFLHFSGFLLYIGGGMPEGMIAWLAMCSFHLVILLCNRFTFHFLQVSTILPAWRGIFRVGAIAPVVLMGLVAFIDAKSGVLLTIFTSLGSLAILLAAALTAYQQGFLPARYYLLGWAGLACCGLVFGGMTIGLLPRNVITYNAPELGSALEALFFSFALAARMRRMQAEKQAALSQLARQDKMAALGMVSAGVAHEINNPTQFTQMSVENARASTVELREFVNSLMDEPDPEIDAGFARRFRDIDEQLGLAREGTGRIADIVRNMRAASRIDHDGESLFSPAQSLMATVSLVRLSWRHVADFNVRVDETIRIKGRPSSLGQVFTNLLVNACHAIEERQKTEHGAGVVDVTSSMHGKELHIAIIDNGCGMSADTLSRLAEPFFTTKGVERGTGLGMGIVRQILQDHGGRLEVQSTPGVGTTMTVVLPVTGQ